MGESKRKNGHKSMAKVKERKAEIKAIREELDVQRKAAEREDRVRKHTHSLANRLLSTASRAAHANTVGVIADYYMTKTAPELLELIEMFHTRVQNNVLSGAGLEMQRMGSQLHEMQIPCMQVLAEAHRVESSATFDGTEPIHESAILIAESQKEAAEAMVKGVRLALSTLYASIGAWSPTMAELEALEADAAKRRERSKAEARVEAAKTSENADA